MGFNLILPDGHSCNYSSPRFSHLQNPIRVEENICNAQGLGGLSVAERDICHFLSYPGTHFEILINYAIIAKSALSLAPISPYLCEPILIIRLCAGVKSAFSKKDTLCSLAFVFIKIIAMRTISRRMTKPQRSNLWEFSRNFLSKEISAI